MVKIIIVLLLLVFVATLVLAQQKSFEYRIFEARERGVDLCSLGDPTDWEAWITSRPDAQIEVTANFPEGEDFWVLTWNGEKLLFVFLPESEHGRCAVIGY